MLKTRLRTSVLALLTACAALSCAPDHRSDLLGPETSNVTTEPDDLLGLTSLLLPPPVPPEGYFLVRERAPNLLGALQISRVLGILGGTLSIAGHTVTVPAGAVSLPTIFTLTLLPNGYVQVELDALTTTLLGRIVNIGEQGFRKPVPVTLTYSRATNVQDPSRLKIMRVNPNGRHEILESKVNGGARTVTAELDHFSRYCMVSH